MELKGIRCNECGRLFASGSNSNGMPNGVGFELADGTIYNICVDCIMKKGEEVINTDEFKKC